MKAERVGLESAGDLSQPRCVAVWRVCIHPCMPALSDDRVTRRKRASSVSECACVLVGSGATYVVCARVSKRARTVLPESTTADLSAQRREGERGRSAEGAGEAGPRMRRTRL